MQPQLTPPTQTESKNARYGRTILIATILAVAFSLGLFQLKEIRSGAQKSASSPGHADADSTIGQSIDLAAVSASPKPHFRSSYSPEAQGEDVKSRDEYELMRLRDPSTGRIPANIRRKELAFAATLPRAEQLGKNGSATAEQWTLRGPRNVGGRTRALAIDLDFNGSSNQKILAGGISGGMHISQDDGQTWTLTTGVDEHASVTTVVQDPSNKSVWYYGTGESRSNSANGLGASFLGVGVFKSTNGGLSWTLLPSTSDGDPQSFDRGFDKVWTLDVHPTNGDVYAALYGQIERSTDGGASWNVVLGSINGSTDSQSTDVHVASDGDIYATLSRNGTGKADYGIYRAASNDPTNFQNISPPGLANDPYRIVLNSSPSDPSTVYVLVQTAASGANASEHQFFRYNEGSNSWQNLTASLPNETGVDGNASFTTQGGYDQIVTVHPTNSNTVFIGGTNIYRSTDGGQSYTRIGGYSGPTSYAQFSGHHSDQHALVFYPNDSNKVLSGSDGGVSRNNNILGSPSWTFINTGYVTTQFYGVGVDPNPNSAFVIGGLQDNGTWGTDNASPQTDWFDLFSGDGGYSNVGPGAAMLTVASQLGVMFRATNTGYSNIAPAGASDYQFIVPNVLDPNNANVLYMAEAGGVWRNSDLSGIPEGNQDPTSTNWTFLSASAQSGHKAIMLSVPKSPAGRIFFGTTDYQNSSRIIRVDNAASNPGGIDITPAQVKSQGFPVFVSDVAANPSNGDEIVAVFSNYGVESIWHSTDVGETWTNVGGNLGGVNGPSIRSVVVVPTNSGKVVLVGTSTGVYSATSLNGGGTVWALEGGNVIGNVVVNQLVHRYSDATVTAATHGRGVYQAKVTGGGGSGAAQASADKSSLNIEVLGAGNSGSTTFTLTNTGSASLNYNINATGFAATTVAGKTNTVDQPVKLLLESGGAELEGWVDTIRSRKRAALTSESTKRGPGIKGVGNNKLSGPRRSRDNPTLGKSAAIQSPSSGDFLVNDDGNETASQYVGFGDFVTPFQWLNRFTIPTGGFTLESVLVNMRTETAGATSLFMIITDPQGNELTSGTANLTASPDGKWYELAFTAVQLNAGQVIDIEFIANAAIGFPAGADFEGQVTGSSQFWDGSVYTNLSTQPNFTNGAFLIRAQGTGAQTTNNPPVANIQASKTTANVNETITFNGGGSSDSDGTITQYAWNFGDGGSGNQASVTHAYAAAGSYTTTLTVTDDKGATNSASVGITIGSSQPSRLSASPPSGTLSAGQSTTVTVTYDASGQNLGVYNGTVTVTTNGGNLTLPVTIGVTSVAVEEEPLAVDGSVLHSNFPNPLVNNTTIPYTLDRPGRVRISVYDLSGRKVRTLVDSSEPTGEHEVTWDARDTGGTPVASGIYLLQMETEANVGDQASRQTRKITVMK